MIINILSTGPYDERRREQDGEERWCFHCRKRRVFEYVVLTPAPWDTSLPPDEWPTRAWYGPILKIECAHCKTSDGDMFPGRFREWGGDE